MKNLGKDDNLNAFIKWPFSKRLIILDELRKNACHLQLPAFFYRPVKPPEVYSDCNTQTA